MKTLVLVLVTIFLGGCGKNIIPMVQAASSNGAEDFTDTLCPQGCVYQESPGHYLALREGPQPMTAKSFSYVLPYDFEVQSMDAWIGTAFGTQLECEARLRIAKPDGTWSEFHAEFDKHQDVIGNLHRYFNVHMKLPAGTKITLYHNDGTSLPSVGNNTVMDEIWRIYGTEN